jgi:hypothetical protein
MIEAKVFEPSGRTRAPRQAGEWRFCDPGAMEAAAIPDPGEQGHIEFACPRGHGYCGPIVVGNGFKPAGRGTWRWDGNVERPSLLPSIHCLAQDDDGRRLAGCGWHGYLAGGMWRDA